MAIDYRESLQRDIEDGLLKEFDNDVEVIERLMTVVISKLGDYDVSQRVTDVALIDDHNEKMLKRYAVCIKINGKSNRTIYAYLYELNRFNRAIGGLKFEEVETGHIRKYMSDNLLRGMSKTTIENNRSYLSAFFQWLVVEGFRTDNPCAKIQPVKIKKKTKKPFSDVELDKLRFGCKNEKERAIVELLLASGVRVDELCQLDLDDIDFDRLTVHVRHGKGDKERYTYLTEVAAERLKEYLAVRKPKGDMLFTTNKGRLSRSGCQLLIRELGKRCNIKKVHPHRFRRTCASILAARGMEIQLIQKILGHDDISTTMSYIYIDDSMVQNSYRKYA